MQCWFRLPRSYWYWDWLTNDSSKDFDFHIDAVAAGADAKLKLKLQGFSETDHDINILVNGAAVGSTNWSGPVESILTLEFDPALLLEGDNVLTLTHGGGTGEASYVYLNEFDVSYPRSYTAVDDSLAFAISDDSILVAGSTETTVQTITGFSSAEIKLLDISRPLQPRWIEGMTIDSAAAFEPALFPLMARDPTLLYPVQQSKRRPGYVGIRPPVCVPIRIAQIMSLLHPLNWLMGQGHSREPPGWQRPANRSRPA